MDSENQHLDQVLKEISHAIIYINAAVSDFELQSNYERVHELKLVLSYLQMCQKIILYGLLQD
ncbi:hypothetical protein QFZ28_004010 [Neobacillus niacini]|uniref:hypothetical protein n=1 Tax=Neobacillus niacini TaxID=86668 RepID=UPI0027894452|nr:hypothetical protein [Neobacillus niacini]MDQ1003610.1 hypothetical protein [Neobacillus niacini]